jgi:hypothetical protein
VAENLFLVLTNRSRARTRPFNEWYDTVHVREVLDVPGVVVAQRYDPAEVKVPEDDDLPAQLPPPTRRYLVIYELDREPSWQPRGERRLTG